MPMPAPIIVPRAPPPHKRFGCGGCVSVLSWIVAAFFIVLLCLTISEITYNRQRDQAFLRLKWAELRQRMLGFELLSQAHQQMQQPQQQIQQPVNELPAFPRRQDNLVDDATTTTTTPEPTTPPAIKEEETPVEINDDASPKFDLLRMLLSRMREHAEEMGLKGDMQVHIVEVRPIQANQVSHPQLYSFLESGKISLHRCPNKPLMMLSEKSLCHDKPLDHGVTLRTTMSLATKMDPGNLIGIASALHHGLDQSRGSTDGMDRSSHRTIKSSDLCGMLLRKNHR
ncbi:hypothetical protein ANCCEY_08719 [Ancylostoma ceylanicum]|uniref:Uncharacterized protein n=1 Tax=Ancylostoma ceylanicum TaxID=53326 RepID=A0A0D6LJD5_9BILA|nr:hypothetical protein ANCCEY_08719 [Ancylostoma ceylanicum]